MATIKGIFEPFADYVKKQLKLRQSIIKPKKVIGDLGNVEEITTTREVTEFKEIETESSDFKRDEEGNIIAEAHELPDEMPELLAVTSDVTETETKKSFYPFGRHELFHTYTTEKQCVIRMASGVNINKTNNILTKGTPEEKFTSELLSKYYILEGGTRSWTSNLNMDFGDNDLRRSIFSDKTVTNSNFNSNAAYGSPEIRANAMDGFGDVPMPGITNAQINTKSEDGSLREATVNFVCYNRRQLEVLETLYMRPGYPILLEWGWVPYIKNDGTVENEGYPILKDFFSSNKNLISINLKIKKQKIESGGNYDGFVGYCKNFQFKVRGDGGYDCITEIIAHGEILESLKATTRLIPRIFSGEDFEYTQTPTTTEMGQYSTFQAKGKGQSITSLVKKEYEVVDDMLFLLKSLKANLDQAGIKAALQYIGTAHEYLGSDSTSEFIQVNKPGEDDDESLFGDSLRTVVGMQDNIPIKVTTNSSITNDNSDYNLRQIPGELEYNLDVGEEGDIEFVVKKSRFLIFKDSEGRVLPMNSLNKVTAEYVEGLKEIEDLIKSVLKDYTDKDINNSKKNYDAAAEGIDDYYHDSSRRDDETKYMTEDFGKQRNQYKFKWDETMAQQMRTIEGVGLQTLYDGLILKEISLHQESKDDSGIRKKIFVRWDLICQMLNRKVFPEYQKSTNKDSAYAKLNGETLVELTYLTGGYKTFHDGKTKKNQKAAKYIPYSVLEQNEVIPYEIAPQIQSDSDVLEEGRLNWEAFEKLSKERQAEIKEDLLEQGLIMNEEKKTVTYPPLLGRSYDRDICLMPHQVKFMKKTSKDQGFDKTKNFTSYNIQSPTSYSIGHVYFNLDYLISQYENLALEEYKTTNSLGEERYKRRLKKEFSLHDWITTIWNGVNDACAGFYDFDLHVEHERPHVARIVDFTMSGGSKDLKKTPFEFDPQGITSITRKSHFQSKLDNDFASVISIAAQSPNSIDSLEALSFKAFHKGIKNRFTSTALDSKNNPEQITRLRDIYMSDLLQYENTVRSLILYVTKMNISNYESELITENETPILRSPISPSTAKSLATSLTQQRIALESRYPKYRDSTRTKEYDGSDEAGGKYVGQYRDDLDFEKGSPTYSRNAIIPLTVSLTLDGISGINPLQIFKIKKEKLPIAYQDPNIIFVVKKETHNITSGQDWTTSVEGYLSLLNDNPVKGSNAKITVRTPEQVTADRIDNIIDSFTEWVSNTSTYEGFSWSGVFISWCVQIAVGRNYFKSSTSHAHFFEKNLLKLPDVWELKDPKTTKLEIGDILLQGRNGKTMAYDKFKDTYKFYNDRNEGTILSHSDILVEYNQKGDGYLIGGNVNNDVGYKKIKLKMDMHQAFLTPTSYADGHKTEGGVRECYTHGAILRVKRAGPRSGYGTFIADVTIREQHRWDDTVKGGMTERDEESEPFIRKYIENRFSSPGPSDPPGYPVREEGYRKWKGFERPSEEGIWSCDIVKQESTDRWLLDKYFKNTSDFVGLRGDIQGNAQKRKNFGSDCWKGEKPTSDTIEIDLNEIPQVPTGNETPPPDGYDSWEDYYDLRVE